MTREQQKAKRGLEAAQIDYLLAYRWEPQDRAHTSWKHPKLQWTYTTHDAMMTTRASPNIGW